MNTAKPWKEIIAAIEAESGNGGTPAGNAHAATAPGAKPWKQILAELKLLKPQATGTGSNPNSRLLAASGFPPNGPSGPEAWIKP
jgi:hypothetical protein